MLHNKSTSLISELQNFFTSDQKAFVSIFNMIKGLKISEKIFMEIEKCNVQFRMKDILILLILFPLYNQKDASKYKNSPFYHLFSCGKDVFYRFLNNENLDWRKICYNLNINILKQIEKRSDSEGSGVKCLIIDDTDFQKTGQKMEHIGKIFSHKLQKSILGYKALFCGYFDGKSFFSLDFSLHGEKGKNDKRPFGFSARKLKERFAKKRAKNSASSQRIADYFNKKTELAKVMIKNAKAQKIDFHYVLFDSWFTCHELVKFVKNLSSKIHYLGMIKMGNTKYLFNDKQLSAKQIVTYLRKNKKLKKSKSTQYYYAEAMVDFQGISVKIFFSKASKKGKWHGILTTDLSLNFEQAFKIYSQRWLIEVYFKEAKQYLKLGKCESQNFDAQIAHTSLCMLQYNVLSAVKRLEKYETLGVLFRESQQNSLEQTLNVRILALLLEMVQKIAEIFDTDTEEIMGKLVSENQDFTK